jgi:hypothetical protein
MDSLSKLVVNWEGLPLDSVNPPKEEDFYYLHTLYLISPDKTLGDLSPLDWIFEKAFNARKSLGTYVLVNAISQLLVAL